MSTFDYIFNTAIAGLCIVICIKIKKQYIKEKYNKQHIKEKYKDNFFMGEYYINKYQRLIDDKNIVIEAVKQNGLLLYYALDKFKIDKDVVLEAIKQNPLSFKYASMNIRGDKKIILTVLSNNGLMLKYCSKNAKMNKELVITALFNNRNAINYACNKLSYLDNLSWKELEEELRVELRRKMFIELLIIFYKKRTNRFITYNISQFIY